MELFYPASQKELDDFIAGAADNRGAEFLQSWQWGELLKKEGKNVLRAGIRSKKKDGRTAGILAVITIIKYHLGGGYSYWYAPRGPIIKPDISESDKAELENYLFLEISRIDLKAIFLRIEPKGIISGRLYKSVKIIDVVS